MNEFFEKNKVFIGIIIAGLLIAGAIHFSNRSSQNPTQKNTTETPSLPSQGILNEPQPQPEAGSVSCINYRDAENYVGEYKCVTGKIDNVFTSSKGNNFLNFCPDYRTCSFSATIFSSDAYKFSNIKGYSGKTVEITGLVKTYQGRAEIIINNPSQIKIK